MLPTRIDPVRDAVSLYGAGAYRWLYQLEVVGLGVGAALLVASLQSSRVSRTGLIALSLYALSRILIAAFPVDRADERVTVRVAVHLVLAAITFIAIAVAAWLVTSTLPSAWQGLRPAQRVLAILVTLSTASTLASNGLAATRAIFGLVERAWYATSIAWLVVLALGLLLLP